MSDENSLNMAFSILSFFESDACGVEEIPICIDAVGSKPPSGERAVATPTTQAFSPGSKVGPFVTGF